MAEFVVEFEAIDNAFDTEFEGFTPVSDGGFERGYQDGYADALSKRTDLVVTENGEYAPSEGSTGFKSVSVNVASNVPKILDSATTELTAEDLQGVTDIRSYGFYRAKELKQVTIPNSVTKINSYAFGGCSALTSIHIPKSVVQMHGYAFQGCSSLASVTFDKESPLISIPDYAFQNGSKIPSIALPDNIKTIGSGAFRSCTGLSSVSVGASVTHINSYAFYDCKALKRFVLKTTTPPLVQSNTFGNTPTDCVFVVPYGYGDAYKTATNWSAYADQIIEGDE